MAKVQTTPAQRGIGSVSDVLSALCNLPDSEDGTRDLLVELNNTLAVLLVESTTSAAAMAVIASYLNRDFRKHGYLYYSTNQGRLTHDYTMDINARNNIADLANLP